MSGSEKHLRKVCKGATIEQGRAIIGNQAAQSRDKVVAWAKKMV